VILSTESERVLITANGKFLHAGEDRFLIKGVTYGTFVPDGKGLQFPSRDRVVEDLTLMARVGINTVRLYTPPSPELLDEMARQGLRALVGIPWPQHVAFLDDRQLCRGIRRDVVDTMRALKDHPAVLLFALGNEIPPRVVRWHGRQRIERFLRDLYDEAKSVSPDSLLTYVNYPPTENLDLAFFDVCTFNVYLHHEAPLRTYVAHLHHIAGNRPLLLAEVGADSLREGEAGQAALAAMQLRAVYEEGACGAIVFGWTDDWWRGGYQIRDWAFGLSDVERRPKPALDAVARVFAAAPFRDDQRCSWPRVSVVVCAHNAADMLEDCLTALERMTYPNFEVLLVNDGPDASTEEVVQTHPSVRLIQIPHGGLSVARNAGLAEASGDIVAYTDADVRVDPDWLTYLIQPLLSSPDIVESGGPNVVPPDDPWMAQCVARAPGGPACVLLDDRIAEHVPGCNMAFRRDALLAIGGFTPLFVRAGDDVDVCWRLQARGGKIAFAPSALVWHHHRATLRGYWRQQVGYGEGESWLKALHPDKFIGRRTIWHGHIYSPLPFIRSLSRLRVHAGTWGSAAFPSVYRLDARPFAHLPHSGRWLVFSLSLLLAGVLSLLSGARVSYGLLAVGAVGVALTLSRCITHSLQTEIDSLPSIGKFPTLTSRIVYRVAIAWLHVIQPLARMHGRIRGILSLPRISQTDSAGSQRARPAPSWPDGWRAFRLLTGARLEDCFWSESWADTESLLTRFTDGFRRSRAVQTLEIDHGWSGDRDVSIGIARSLWLTVLALVEDHGAGKCLLRIRIQLRLTALGAALAGAAGLSLLGLGFRGATVGLAAAGLSLGLLFFAVWRVAWATTLVRATVGAVAAEAGMIAMTSIPRPEPTAHSFPWLAHSPRSASFGERAAIQSMVVPVRETLGTDGETFQATGS
jgi:O-antigen biosynthesis protein